jgi:hypothetical protein
VTDPGSLLLARRTLTVGWTCPLDQDLAVHVSNGPTPPHHDPATDVDTGGSGTCSPAAVAAWTQRDLRWEELLEQARQLGPDPELATVADHEVEALVCEIAGQLAAMTCRWLGYVAELVVRGIWAEQGARTPAQWLSWKVGVASSTAREHVRVALRLRELPAIHTAFAAGRLSYSKVRALTRFAVPELEPLLLRWADAATAVELDRIAANFRSSQRSRLGDPNHEGDTRYGWRERLHHDGTMTVSIRGPVEEMAELRERLERRCQLAATPARAPAGADSDDGAPAGADDHGRAPAGADSDDGAPAGADEPGGEVLHRSTGEQLAQELLHTVLVADPDTVVDTSGLDRHTLVLYTDAASLAATATSAVPVQDGRRRVRSLDPRVLRRLACEAGIVVAAVADDGTPLDLGRRQRRLSTALRRAVHLRDRTCTFPGCHTTRHLHAHHVEHWSDGGPTDLANLALLCSHHHRFVHEHLCTIEVRPDGRHRFTLPGGAPLPHAGRTGRAAVGQPTDAAVPLDHGPRPLDALQPRHWAGPATADHDLILAVLQQEFGRLAPDLVTAA